MLRKYPYGGGARVSLHLAPSICLLAASGLVACFDRWKLSAVAESRTLRITFAALGLLALVGIARDLRKPTKTVDDARLRTFVRELERQHPAEVPIVVISSDDLAANVEWYFRHSTLPVRFVEHDGLLERIPADRFITWDFAKTPTALRVGGSLIQVGAPAREASSSEVSELELVARVDHEFRFGWESGHVNHWRIAEWRRTTAVRTATGAQTPRR
jgi:hypothetical protein